MKPSTPRPPTPAGAGAEGAKVLGIRLPENCLVDTMKPVGVLAKASLPSDDAMNGTERKYATEILEVRKQAGEISRWDFEAVKLRLADRTWLSVDFRVILADCTEEYHEVKGGFIRDDAMAKLKIAAELHPYRFVLAQYKHGSWKITHFEARKR